MALPAIITLASCHRQKPAPSIDGLSAALERSAEKSLAAPSLADEQIVIPAKPGQTAAQTSEIERSFTLAGGTALTSTNTQGQISILGDVPEVNVGSLKAMLRHEQTAIQSAPASPARLIEVLVVKPAPSPTP
jgi:hypothetical protein